MPTRWRTRPRSRKSRETVSGLVEQLGRDASALTFYEVQLAASHRVPQVREALQGIIVVALIAIAFVTAFALANWAAASALSNVVPDWAAPLILAAAWVLRRPTAPRSRAAPYEGPPGGGSGCRCSWAARRSRCGRTWRKRRSRHGSKLRETLERLSGAVASEAASAMVPLAGGMADGVLEASGGLLEGTDDFVESLTEDVPGGGVVNQVWDVVLLPGRSACASPRPCSGAARGAGLAGTGEAAARGVQNPPRAVWVAGFRDEPRAGRSLPASRHPGAAAVAVVVRQSRQDQPRPLSPLGRCPLGRCPLGRCPLGRCPGRRRRPGLPAIPGSLDEDGPEELLFASAAAAQIVAATIAMAATASSGRRSNLCASPRSITSSLTFAERGTG